AAAVPFAMSFWPSERAKAAGAPVDVDIGKLELGQKINVEWRGKVVWVIHRTKEMLATLPKLDDKVADPSPTSTTSLLMRRTRRARSSPRSSLPSVFAPTSAVLRHFGRKSRRGISVPT